MQLSLDPAQELAAMSITVTRSRNGRSLNLHVTLANDDGAILMRWSKRYRTPRNEAGLPDWVRQVTSAYLYGSSWDVEMAANLGVREHLPQLPAHIA